MASWILVPCLVSLRDEFNQLAPDRDKASDGSIGDTAHSANSSDHNPDETGNTPAEDDDSTNEVHAIDVDDDLRKPGWSMTKCVEIIVTRHREGRDDRLQNVIYNRRIWSRSWGWTAREYTGSNAHTAHAHFSARYTTAQERDTSPWGLLEEDDVTKAEFTAWMTEWARSTAGREALARAVLAYDPGKDPAGKVPTGAIANPDPKSSAANPTVGAAWGLNRAIVASILGYQLRDLARAGLENDKSILAKLGASDADLDAIQAQIAAIPDAVLDQLGDASQTPEEVAAALRAVLGDRAGAVGQLLAAPAAPAA